MYCRVCGNEIKENANFCPVCGTPVADGITEVKEDKEAEVKTRDMAQNGGISNTDIPNADIPNASKPNDDMPNDSMQKEEMQKHRAGAPQKRRPGKLIGIAAGLIIVAAAVVLAVILFGKKGEEETFEKLHSFTELYQTENGYAFLYNGEWELNYTQENEFVRISITDAAQYLAEIFGVGSLGDDGTCSYDLDNGNMNIYCDVIMEDGGSLSVITYNVEDGKFTFLIDGERYEPVEDFATSFEDYGIGDLLSAQTQYFEGTLADNGITVEEVAELSYDTIKDCIENKEITLAEDDSTMLGSVELSETLDDSGDPDETPDPEDMDEPGTVASDSQEIFSENLLTDPGSMGWGGAYIDDYTGEKLVIAMIGYEYSYKLINLNGEVFQQEKGCVSDVDYLEGQYYILGKNENGLIGVTSGVGGLWGDYRRVSGTVDPDDQIEGTYGDSETIITVSDQMASITDDYVPSGADIAAATVNYNNGLVIEGRLYTQQDGSLALIDTNSGTIQGILTFTDHKVTAVGSGFDGTYTLSE